MSQLSFLNLLFNARATLDVGFGRHFFSCAKRGMFFKSQSLVQTTLLMEGPFPGETMVRHLKEA
jgi:hypothetical protein